MSNLRICYNNVADASTLSASSAAGTLSVSNLLTDWKSQPWRSTSTSAQLTLTWTNAVPVSMLVLPWTNLTAAATIRVRGYANTTDVPGTATALVDTGVVTACLVGAPTLAGLPAGVNAFTYGGAACARVYFATTNVKKLYVELIDSGNAAGYIEASRIICGLYWEPTYNADVGATVTAMDPSSHTRTEAGELRTMRSFRVKKLTMTLSKMPIADRNALWSILRVNGIGVPFFISMFPNAADGTEEDIHQMYAKLSAVGAITYETFGASSSQLEMEEV